MISKKALIESNYGQQIHFTNSAREAWEIILNTLSSNDKLLLPSYIGVTEREGSGIYDPVLSNCINHDFYFLNNDLSLSFEHLKKLIENGEYKMILLVHYFGFKLSNLNSIIALCKRHNVVVVEDCAHLYNYNAYNYSDAGVHADYVFYSLHKFFPIKSGGLLVKNNEEQLSKCVFKTKLIDNYAETILKYDIQGIISKRIENFNFLNELILKVDGVIPFKVFKNGDVPHNYPIIVENNFREGLYYWLIDKNVTLIALYYRLISSLPIEKYKRMHNISNSILNLPIHQDITKNDLINLVDLISEGIKKLRNG